MAFQPWIRFEQHTTEWEVVSASIGPWLFSHGYYPTVPPTKPTRKCFNWAMAFQPWIQQYIILRWIFEHLVYLLRVNAFYRFAYLYSIL